MINPQIKDAFYKELLDEPTKEKFREFIHKNCGEFDNIDFKTEWISKGKLAKILLALANSRGGIIVFGIKEDEQKNIIPDGIEKIKDKASINNDIAKYVPPELDYQVFDFSFDSSDYQSLKNKKFQMIVVTDTPDRLPFISLAETDGLEKDTIYVRRGTKCVKATSGDIETIIEAKLSTIYSGNSDMPLNEHLEQLKTLYNELPKTISVLVKKGKPSNFEIATRRLGEIASRVYGGTPDIYDEIENPEYPKESYEAFILRMVNAKKLRIEKVLDVK